MSGLNDAERIGLLRIIDAEANRASEGLRVIEDYVRFILDDRHLMTLAKQLRHDLTSALTAFSSVDRLIARDAAADVGADVTLPSNSIRADAAAVAAASFKRVQQAMRGLEEYCKTLEPAAAAKIEALRYRCYTLERAVGISADSHDRLAEARLYVLLDGRANEDEFCRLAESLVAAGVQILQLRDKRLNDRELLGRARRLRQATLGSKTLFVMNDRPDLALLADADGVHVGQEELTVKDVRSVVGPRMLVGVSTHSVEQARRAVLDGASYIGVGPTFPSTTKTFEEFTGLELLQMVAAEVSLPAFAIGGITRENGTDVLATGIHGVAVGGDIVNAGDPAIAAQEWYKMIASACVRRTSEKSLTA